MALFNKYYSQYGEDKFLMPLLPEKGVFVEVGAGDGITLSNSLAFENKGWTGLIIEPDIRRSLSHRRCQVSRMPIAPKRGYVNFYLAPNPDLSKISDEGKGTVKLAACTLNQVLRIHDIKEIDLLSLDTEGTELEIWKSFDSEKYKPKFVIIEWLTLGLPSREKEIKMVFPDYGYELIHKTTANLIYRRIKS